MSIDNKNISSPLTPFIKLDNGRINRSNNVKNMLASLGVQPLYISPYNPTENKIERFFRKSYKNIEDKMPKKKKAIFHVIQTQNPITLMCGTPVKRCENLIKITHVDLVKKSDNTRLCHKCNYIIKLKKL